MKTLKILEVSPEVAPFARTGGLGDVLGALPGALTRLGHEVVVAMPKYGSIDGARFQLVRQPWTATVPVDSTARPLSVETLRNRRTRVSYWFIGNDHYFNRPEYYRDPETGKDYVDNDERFIFFTRAVIETARRLNWVPDIIHCHDWQAGLLPVYIKHGLADGDALGGARTVLTIHNLGYQGVFSAERFPKIGVPEDLFHAMTGPFEFYGKVNFLKAAIVTADRVTTVSERYAEEIQSSDEFGAGLEGVLSDRRAHLKGIVNGVDYTVWSPSRDKLIPYRYNLANLSGKKKTKIELLNRAGLPVREQAPLIGIISRLADQKGFDLLAAAADELFAMDIQMVLLGTGDEKYHKLLTELEQKYPDKLKTYLTFDDELAHWIEASSDLFLMPSRYEPCGLNQLYSLKYGTVPVVRRVGGLADTVVDYDHEALTGTGFVFDDYSAVAMLEAVRRGVALFGSKRPWIKLVKNCMSQDFSWNASARKYADLFTQMSA